MKMQYKKKNYKYITTAPLSGIIAAPRLAVPSEPIEAPGPIEGLETVARLFMLMPIMGGGPWVPAGAGLYASM